MVTAAVRRRLPRPGLGHDETNAITVSIGGKEYLDRPGSCGKPNHMWDLRVLDEGGLILLSFTSN